MRRVRKSQKKFVLALLLIVVVGVACIVAWKAFKKSPDGTTEASKTSTQEMKQNAVITYSNLQPVIDKWITTHSGTYAVKITDPNGKTLAVTNGDEQFFTASLYKLFVAYVGYQKIDDGTYRADQPYISGYTRAECLDAMIRASYSPCGEAWWNELGKDTVTQKMKSLGLTNTSLTGLLTTANDTDRILLIIHKGVGLSSASRAAYLDSMQNQDAKYRRGLPSGFTESNVYNKVGWNQNIEWHDASIVVLPNGRTVMVAVLTKNVGYQNVAALGTELQKALQ